MYTTHQTLTDRKGEREKEQTRSVERLGGEIKVPVFDNYCVAYVNLLFVC